MIITDYSIWSIKLPLSRVTNGAGSGLWAGTHCEPRGHRVVCDDISEKKVAQDILNKMISIHNSNVKEEKILYL